MQGFNFGVRKSSAENTGDAHSRYHVTSSIYSGPGPAEEEMPEQPNGYVPERPNGSRTISQEQHPRYNPLNQAHPRSSSLLNTNDPVAMHLLMETAIGDSKDYEILSFEEVEQLKKERMFLRNRLDATRKKLNLETKLRDAAQSLNRLYSTKGRPPSGQQLSPNDSAKSPGRQRRSLLGGRNSSHNDTLTRADDEYAASIRKIEEFTQEMARLEKRLEDVERRILQHTAGILQMTHRGLKKNIRRQEIPRSPESMSSTNHRNISGVDGIEDFDERSLYQVPSYVTDFRPPNAVDEHGRKPTGADPTLDAAEKQLADLSRRLHGMILQADPDGRVNPPHRIDGGLTQPRAQIHAHLGYLATGLDAMEAAQTKTIAAAQKSLFDSENQLEDVNVRLHDMLERTNSIGQDSLIVHAESRGKSIQSQLAFSAMVLERLNGRMELLMEQKDILTRQIQQQRELNSKSDGQRDAQIRDLLEQLAEAKHLHTIGEQDAQQAQNHINMLTEELDLAKHENLLIQQQQGLDQNRALQAEKEARREVEESLLADLRTTQQHHQRVQAELAEARDDIDMKAQQHVQQVNEVSKAKGNVEVELERHRTRAQGLEEQLNSAQSESAVRLQTLGLQVIELRKATESHAAETQEAHHEIERLTQEKSVKDAKLEQVHAQIETLAREKAAKSTEVANARLEIENLEADIMRVQTELTLVKAELDGAYGTRAQRAADVSRNPVVQKEIDDLHDRNTELQRQLSFLRTEYESKGAGSAELENKVNTLQSELRETIEDYQVMTKASIEFEKERDRLEAAVDGMRERCESMEAQLSDERVKWLGVKASAPTETTSTMVLKNEFKKMMRDTRAENVKALRAEQDERRRLEGVIRTLRKDVQQPLSQSNLKQGITAS